MNSVARFTPPNDKETFSYSIEEHARPGKVIGSIGVHYYYPPEFGYILAQATWGQGYATEAVRAFLRVYWALERKTVDLEDEEYAHERLRAVTDVDNRASRRVLEKSGFTFDVESESHGRSDARYHLEAPE
jgi:RimJ/RimL family protein N-acetyltransferase